MLYTPDLHYCQQIDELKGHWFGRYRPICDPTVRSGHHCVYTVLMVIAITISSLRTVNNTRNSLTASILIDLGVSFYQTVDGWS